jgi:hypothetical protein
LLILDLSDKAKPSVRRGRKATGLKKDSRVAWKDGNAAFLLVIKLDAGKKPNSPGGMMGATSKVHKILTHPAFIVAGALLLAILALWSQTPDSRPLYCLWR